MKMQNVDYISRMIKETGRVDEASAELYNLLGRDEFFCEDGIKDVVRIISNLDYALIMMKHFTLNQRDYD